MKRQPDPKRVNQPLIHKIKQHVLNGGRVYWSHKGYEVLELPKGSGRFLIHCHMNDHCIGLHGQIGTRFEHQLNGFPEEFIFESEGF